MGLSPQIKKYGYRLLGVYAAILLIYLYAIISTPLAKADVAVILGTTVYSNGKMSDRLEARVSKGLALYQQGLVNHIIVSGGVGKEGVNEAVVMADYLKQNGVPGSNIFVDGEGNNTQLTAINSLKIMQTHDFKSVVVVSQYFHVPRSRLAFQQQGVSDVYGAYPLFFSGRDFYSINREIVAYLKYLFI